MSMQLDEFYRMVSPLSLTSRKRIEYLFGAMERIRSTNIEGDLVECGVYRGGNILGMMEYCRSHAMQRDVFAYDTFTGMTPHGENDVSCTGGLPGQDTLCACSLKEFSQNVARSVEMDCVSLHVVCGDVADTLNIEAHLPKSIALLRLDTDWYASTKKELEVLYPRVVPGGIVIVDDYGHWRGSKKAVDEFFHGVVHWTAIDYTGIAFQKPEVECTP